MKLIIGGSIIVPTFGLGIYINEKRSDLHETIKGVATVVLGSDTLEEADFSRFVGDLELWAVWDFSWDSLMEFGEWVRTIDIHAIRSGDSIHLNEARIALEASPLKEFGNYILQKFIEGTDFIYKPTIRPLSYNGLPLPVHGQLESPSCSPLAVFDQADGWPV